LVGLSINTQGFSDHNLFYSKNAIFSSKTFFIKDIQTPEFHRLVESGSIWTRTPQHWYKLRISDPSIPVGLLLSGVFYSHMNISLGDRTQGCITFMTRPRASALGWVSTLDARAVSTSTSTLSNLQISVADPGCLYRTSDPNFFHPGSEFFPTGSRIRIKEYKYFNPKKWFLNSRKYDPGCSSRFRISDPEPDFLPIPDPGSRGQEKRHRIPDPQHCCKFREKYQKNKIKIQRHYEHLNKILIGSFISQDITKPWNLRTEKWRTAVTGYRFTRKK